jgi:hypothetical protein
MNGTVNAPSTAGARPSGHTDARAAQATAAAATGHRRRRVQAVVLAYELGFVTPEARG